MPSMIKVLGIVALCWALYMCIVDPALKTLDKESLRDNMSVKVEKFYKLRDYMHVTGVIENNNDCPASAHVKLTCYNTSNNIIKVRDFWPNSTSNIAPHSKSSFEYMFEAVPNIKTMDSEIIGAKTW